MFDVDERWRLKLESLENARMDAEAKKK